MSDIILKLGDCVELLDDIQDNSIDLVITSPPYYNSSHKYQRGTGFHYTQDIGEPLYVIYDCMEKLYNKLKIDGIVCLNIGFSYGETGVMRPFDIVQRIRSKLGYFVNDLIIWHKNNPIPIKNRLTNSYEFIFILSKHPIGKYYTTEYTHNVWDIPVSQGVEGHSATFPLELPITCLQHFSKVGDTVLDPFMGSGTTGVACKQLNRNFIGMEINEDYLKLSKERIDKSSSFYIANNTEICKQDNVKNLNTFW